MEGEIEDGEVERERGKRRGGKKEREKEREKENKDYYLKIKMI